jgi:calcineurin-like phosphoesterase family protein
MEGVGIMKEWLITDTHFDHDNIGVYCARPDGWHDLILKNWREIVKPEDVVFHLGDVQVGRKHKLTELLYSVPGTKVLIRGNHDNESCMWYMRNGFSAAVDGMKYHGVTFTHQPETSLYSGTDINIHGHVHNSEWKPMHAFQRLLALEYVNYRPVDMLKFINMARSKSKWEEFVKTWAPRPRIDEKRKNAVLDM